MRRRNLFISILLNCFCPDGSINWTRTWRETKYLVRFVSTLLLILFLFFGICATPIVLVHSYIIPIPIVMDVLSVFSINEEVWEDNVFIGDGRKALSKYETWRKKQGISKQRAMSMQQFLWDTWYIWAAFALYAMFFFYLLLVKLFIKLFNRYKKKVFRREEVYSSRDYNYSIE